MLRASATAKKKRVLRGRKGNASFIHHIFSFLHDAPEGECAVPYPPVASSVPFKSGVLISSELSVVSEFLNFPSMYAYVSTK